MITSHPPLASGEKAKARDILAAIRTLKRIEQEQRPATPEERQALARFAGFGPVALSLFPDPVTGHYKDATWQTLGEELQTLLTPEEYDSAKRTTFNAFYTSPTVIAAMHEALARLGVPAQRHGPGARLRHRQFHAPWPRRACASSASSWTRISGRIARALHPGHDIRIENFRDTRLPEDRIDAVIGNVPFADLKLDYRGQKLSLHDFFFAKSIDALKPGGVLALVTTHFTLDKQNAAIREYLAAKADFVGAIRLPSDAFKREGTAVVTDIVFLRKRAPGEPAQPRRPRVAAASPRSPSRAWTSRSTATSCNHPEMVLGTWSRKDTLYGGEGYSVTGNGDLAGQLERRHPPPAGVRSAASIASPGTNPPRPSRRRRRSATSPKAASSSATTAIICQSHRRARRARRLRRHDRCKADGTLTGKRLAALIGLRDHARRVLQSQNEGWPEAHRNEARRELNRAYDRFVGTYGPINKTTFGETADGSVIRRMPNLVKFREDPDAMLVMSLEDYDEVTGKATKAAIMTQGRGRQDARPSRTVRSAEEGLLVSLNQRGAVDLPFIADALRQARSSRSSPSWAT